MLSRPAMVKTVVKRIECKKTQLKTNKIPLKVKAPIIKSRSHHNARIPFDPCTTITFTSQLRVQRLSGTPDQTPIIMKSCLGGVGLLTLGLLWVEHQHSDHGAVRLPDGVYDRELELVNP